MLRRLPLIRLPLFWGSLAFLGFYALIDRGVLQGGLVERYFTSHPVEYVTTALFFVGISALVIKGVELAGQYAGLARVTLGPAPAGGQLPSDVDRLAETLTQQSGDGRGAGYLVRRLHEALDYVRRKRSASALDEHLRYLADLDVDRMHSSYALTRVVIWAIPTLGFLGTVVGITLAVAKLSPEALETSLPEVTAGLGVAFDTTALALTLSILLMFAKFFVERADVRLLSAVDARVSAELVGRFQDFGATADPHLAAVREMVKAVVQSTETLVSRQTELWRSTLDAAHHEWSGRTARAGEQFEQALAGALRAGLKQHAESMTAAEESFANANREHWDRVQRSLEESSRIAVGQQAELVKQGYVFREIVEATGEVRRLETTLNENLSALAGAKNFEDTVMSLAAAIQLLSTRLGCVSTNKSRVQLPSRPSATSSAA